MISYVVAKKGSQSALPTLRARPFSAMHDTPSRLDNLLSPEEQERLASIATVLQYRRGGGSIFSEGEDAHFVYAIDSGLVRLSRHIRGGQRQVVAFLFPGDLFGVASRGRYVNSVDALGPVTVYRFPVQKLKRLLLQEPTLQLHLLLKAVHELRMAQRHIIVLGKYDAYARLASCLLDFAQHADFFDAASGRLTLPVSRFDLADYLGTSAETITRAFARLERLNLIRRVSPRIVELLDFAGLRSLWRSDSRTRNAEPSNPRSAKINN